MFEINTAGVNKGDSACDLRQLIVSIFSHNRRFQLSIIGFTPCRGD